MVDSSRSVSFAGTNYRVGNAYKRAQVDVAIVGAPVQFTLEGTVIREHPIRHDRAKEHGAFATPAGRPETNDPHEPHRLSCKNRSQNVVRVPELDIRGAAYDRLVRGHLRQRSPGVWEAIVSVGRDPLSGRWRYRSRTIRGTKRYAQRELADFVHEVSSGSVRPVEITVAAALERWLDFVGDDLSPTTLRSTGGFSIDASDRRSASVSSPS
jgi:hypothetical protein